MTAHKPLDPNNEATNTAPACNTCGQREREPRSTSCWLCSWKLRQRIERERLDAPPYDDEGRGK